MTSLISASVGVYFATIATVGYFIKDLHIIKRAIVLCAGLMLIIPGFATDAIGIMVGGTIILIEWKSKSNNMNKNRIGEQQ